MQYRYIIYCIIVRVQPRTKMHLNAIIPSYLAMMRIMYSNFILLLIIIRNLESAYIISNISDATILVAVCKPPRGTLFDQIKAILFWSLRRIKSWICDCFIIMRRRKTIILNTFKGGGNNIHSHDVNTNNTYCKTDFKCFNVLCRNEIIL